MKTIKSTLMKLAVGAAFMTGAAPAFADLIYVNGTQNAGTGLGAVLTVVTGQDNGNGQQQNDLQSACVTYAGGDPSTPNTNCDLGLEGGDNTAGNAGNNTYFLSDIAGLDNAGELGFVVNISEGGDGTGATLTDLYLSLFNTTTNLFSFYEYMGADKILSDTGGIGQAGTHRFILDEPQAAAAALFCPVLSECVAGAGIQFLRGTTGATPETVFIGAFERDGGGDPGGGEVPEPGSIMLMAAGALAAGLLRRRQTHRKSLAH